MSTHQQQWAAILRAIPASCAAAIAEASDRALRHRPAVGEWSAVEVLGHMVDKMRLWKGRVQRIAGEDQPFLPGMDQDASVREHRYQERHPAELLAQLVEACQDFASLVETLPNAMLERQGVHGELGPITLRQCVELPLESVGDHLAQLRSAMAAAE